MPIVEKNLEFLKIFPRDYTGNIVVFRAGSIVVPIPVNFDFNFFAIHNNCILFPSGLLEDAVQNLLTQSVAWLAVQCNFSRFPLINILPVVSSPFFYYPSVIFKHPDNLANLISFHFLIVWYCKDIKHYIKFKYFCKI